METNLILDPIFAPYESLITSSKELTNWFNINQDQLLFFGFVRPSYKNWFICNETADAYLKILATMSADCLISLSNDELTDEEKISTAISSMDYTFQNNRHLLVDRLQESYSIIENSVITNGKVR